MANEKVVELLDRNEAEIEQLIAKKIDIWRDHVVFTAPWWLGVALTVLPWLVWWPLRKRTSTARLLYAGLFVALISITIDIVGDQLGLWHYRYNVIPFLPTYVPWGLTLMPVAVMLLLQWEPGAGVWAKSAIFAALSSFAAEPLFEMLGIYKPVHWHSAYSFPIQFFVFAGAWAFTKHRSFVPLDESTPE